MTRTICLHGPESTGKSTMAPRLAAHFGAPLVLEYGRIWCETFGTDLTMDELVLIASEHDALTCAALKENPAWLIADTDPMMTAVWADMLFGVRDPWFDHWRPTADLYLLYDIDIPWVADGTRMFGDPVDRARFLDLSRQELERQRVRWAWVRGDGEERFNNALAAIHAVWPE